MSASDQSSDQRRVMIVLGAYGTTMQQVQAFELVLACLVAVVSLATPAGPPADAEGFLDDMWRLVHAASAGQMRNRLKGRISEGLLDEIEVLVSWRNFLAHRYLRTRLIAPTSAPALTASVDDVVELEKLARAFTDGSQHVRAGTATFLETAATAGHLTAVPPAALYASIEAAVRRMVLAQPPRFESIEATPSGDPV